MKPSPASEVRRLAPSTRFAAVLSALLLVLPSSSRAAYPCGCPSGIAIGWPAEHRNAYTNMLLAVEAADGSLKRAKDAYERVTKSAEAIRKDRIDIEAIPDELLKIHREYDQVELSTSPDLLLHPEMAKALVSALQSITGRVAAVDGRIKAAFDDAEKGYRREQQRLDEASGQFDQACREFDVNRNTADSEYLYNRSYACVKELHERDLYRKKTSLSSWRENAEKRISEEARSDIRKIENAKIQIDGNRAMLSGMPKKIADRLGGDDPKAKTILGPEDLIDYLKELVVPRSRVRFHTQIGLPPEPEVLRRGQDPLRKPQDPQDPRDRVGFLHWATRQSSGEAFEGWENPVSVEILDLDAVWGHRVQVSGADIAGKSFTIPMRGSEPATFSRLFALPEFVEMEKEVKASPPKGQAFAGWRIVAGADVNSATPIPAECDLEPVYEYIQYFITWFDKDGQELLQPDGTPWVRGPYTAKNPPERRALPGNPNGFRYKHWSNEPGGEAWEGWGKPLSENLSLYAVADEVEPDPEVTFLLRDGTEIGRKTFRKGESFRPGAEGVPRPQAVGQVFRGWSDASDGSSGKFEGSVTKDLFLYAVFRSEILSETLERMFAEPASRYPWPLVAAVDTALFVVFVVLLLVGRRPRRRKSGEATPAEKKEAPSTSEPPAEGAPQA